MATIQPAVSKSVNLAIDNIQITFIGAQTIATSDLFLLEKEMEEWFEAYYNDKQGMKQRFLNLQQLQYRVPDVHTMVTAYHMTSQDTSTTQGWNTVTFTQNLAYVAPLELEHSVGYAILPFADASYKALLLERLVANTNFFTGVSAISTPVVLKIQNEYGLATQGAIVCVASTAIVSFILGAVVSFYIVKKRKVTSANLADMLFSAQVSPIALPNNAHIAIHDRNSKLAAAAEVLNDNDCILQYNDQIQSVAANRTARMVAQAILHPKTTTPSHSNTLVNDGSCRDIPMTTLVVAAAAAAASNVTLGYES